MDLSELLIAQIVEAFMFLMICAVLLLGMIAWLLSKSKPQSGTTIVEKHYVNKGDGLGDKVKVEEDESPEEHKKKVERDINLSRKYQKKAEVQVSAKIGNKTSVSAESSLDAVEKMRRMNKDRS